MNTTTRAAMTFLAGLAVTLAAGCGPTTSVTRTGADATAGAGATGASTAVPRAPTTTTPGTLPTGPARPTSTVAGTRDATRARTCALRATLRDPSSAKFQQAVTLVLTNTSTVTCTVSGYVSLTFTRDGRRLPVNTTRHAVPAPRLTLRPGASGTAMLLWLKYEGQGDTCPPFPDTVHVTPPGSRAAAGTAWLPAPEGSICGGRVEVWPLGPAHA